MSRVKIAVTLACLKVAPDEGIRIAAEMGVEGVHLCAGPAPLDPEHGDVAARKNLVKDIRALGMEISSLCAGMTDFGEPEEAEAVISETKNYVDMAADLDTEIVQTHIGCVPQDTSSPRWQLFVDVAGEIAHYCESHGTCLAIETGPEPPKVLKRLIETIGSPALRINYDPANLIIWPLDYGDVIGQEYTVSEALAEYEPVEGVRTLGKYIVHTHAKDAAVLDKPVEHAGRLRRSLEVPLGEGDIDWPRYVQLLNEEGFNGYYAIEREVGEDPVGDIRAAVQFLRSL